MGRSQRQLADIIIVIYDWVKRQHPVATTLLQISKQMTDTQIDQIPGARVLVEVISDVFQMQDMRERLHRYNVTGHHLKNITAVEVAVEIINKYNLSLSDIPIDKLGNLVDYAQKVPGLASLVDTALRHQVNGVPFAMTLVNILSPVITDIPMSQWNNMTLIRQTAANAYRQLKPYANANILSQYVWPRLSIYI